GCRQCRAGAVLVDGRSQILVRPPRYGLAGSRIPDLRHLVEVGRARSRRPHDRPARSLYVRRGVKIQFFFSKLLGFFPRRSSGAPVHCGWIEPILGSTATTTLGATPSPKLPPLAL